MGTDHQAWAASDEWLTTDELALLTSTSASFWEKLRVRGGADSIPFARIGTRIRYRRTDVEAWLRSRTVRSTSEREAS